MSADLTAAALSADSTVAAKRADATADAARDIAARSDWAFAGNAKRLPKPAVLAEWHCGHIVPPELVSDPDSALTGPASHYQKQVEGSALRLEYLVEQQRTFGSLLAGARTGRGDLERVLPAPGSPG